MSLMPVNATTKVEAKHGRDHNPAWEGQGILLDAEGKKGLTVEQALPASGLDWTVEKVPLMAYLPPNVSKDPTPPKDGVISPKGMTTVRSRFGAQRMDTGEILGTVGETWQPVQNLEGFAILNDVIAQASALDAGYNLWIKSAGTFDNGRKVWVLAHIDQELQIAGEDYRNYLLFMNGHDGRTSVTAASMTERFFCSNQLNYGPASKWIVRVRHTTKAAQRIQEAHTILGMRNQRAEELAKQGEWLVNKKFNEKAFQDFLAELMPIPEPDTPAATMVADRRAAVTRIYQDAPNLESIRGTRWGALQSVVEYADHGREFRDDTTKLKANWGITPATIKDRALDLLTA